MKFISKRQLFTWFICLILCFESFGQDRPVTVSGKQFNTDNYYEIIQQMDDYWNSHPDRFKKGSGFKVYQRWKELWKNYIHSDGTLMSPAEISQSFISQNPRYNFNNASHTSHSTPVEWMPLGPYTHDNRGSWSPGQGRVNVTTVDPSNPNTIYVGTPNGGLWKSTNHGNSWTNLTDYLPSIGISGIAVDYNNSDVIYISTGDEDASDSFSSGIYKSTDGGSTWAQTGFPSALSWLLTGEIYIHPENSDILWVVSNIGFYKTIDGGNTWQQKISNSCKEIRLKPGDPNTLYVVEESGSNRSIRRSTNGGETFTTIQSYTGAGRTVIDVTPANPEYLYVLVSNQNNSFRGVYRSTDGGNTFTTRNTTTDIYDESGQAYFDLAITVSDTNPDVVFTGCLNIWKSTDGGATFSRINNWNNPSQLTYTHADIHDLKFYNQKLYAGTDGGIYISENEGNSFEDKTINGLAIGQFYRIDVAQSSGTNIAGGLQDNGGYAYTNDSWSCFYGADGMDAAIHPQNPTLKFGFIQFGLNLYRLNNSNSSNTGQFVANSPNGTYGNWITPLEFGNQGTLYAGFERLYRLQGSSWVSASSMTFGSINHIRVAHDNDNKVLVSNNSGSLFLSDGSTPLFFSLLFMPGTGDIINFDFNRNQSNTLYVIKGDNIYKSTNNGDSWIDITHNLSGETKVGIIHQASSYNNTLYIALTKGVYYTYDGLNEWIPLGTGLPNSTITDIEINNVENHVLVSTYGRGVWRIPVTPESLSVTTPGELKTSSHLYPNPVQDNARLNTAINESVVMKVYSLDGKCVMTRSYDTIQTDTTIDLSDLKTGIYIVNFISDFHLISTKIKKN